MITSVVRKDGAVICIHDDYCSHIEATEISHILLKISDLVSKRMSSGVYRSNPSYSALSV